MLASVALLAATAGPAQAQSRWMLNLWKPAPLAGVPLSRTVRRGEAVFRQRLLPTGLKVVQADAVDARSGSVVTPSGSQLFELAGDNQRAWCDTTPPGGTEWPSSPVPRTLPRHRCLMDADGDGRFESSFGIDGTSWAVPAIFARRPSRLRALSEPVPYRDAEPAEMKVEYHVSLIYAGPRPIGGRLFELIVGVGELQDPITSGMVVGGQALPRTFERRGARFTVLSFGEGEATVRVESALPETPMSPIRTLQVRP